MINVKESFEILTKGLALHGIKLDPDDLRSLKFGTARTIPIVLLNTKEILDKFGPENCRQIKLNSLSDFLEFFELRPVENSSKEVQALMVFAWVLLKFRVIERIEEDISRTSIGLNVNKNSSSQAIVVDPRLAESTEHQAKFKSADKENVALMKSINILERKITNMENLKAKKMHRIQTLLKTRNFNYSGSFAKASSLLKKIELQNMIQQYPDFKSSIYLWLQDIAQALLPPLKGLKPLYIQHLLSPESPAAIVISKLSSHKKGIKQFLKAFKSFITKSHLSIHDDDHEYLNQIFQAIQTGDHSQITLKELCKALCLISAGVSLAKEDSQLDKVRAIDDILVAISNVKIRRVNC